MQIDLVYFLPALVLLWVPRNWLRTGRKTLELPAWDRLAQKIKQQREPGDMALRFAEEFTKLRNYVDFLRAAVGGLALRHSIVGGPGQFGLEFGLEELIVLVAVVVQTMQWRGRLRLFPPVFFATGLALAVCGWKAALAGAAVAWVLNFVLPTPTLFLFVHAVTVGLFSYLLNPNWLPAVAAMGVFYLPLVFSAVARQPLSILSRRLQ